MVKYFSLAPDVQNTFIVIRKKSRLDCDNLNLRILFYCGLVKCLETDLALYDQYLEKTHILKCKHPNIRFLIQSDETEF